MNKKHKQMIREFKRQLVQKFEKWKFEKIELVIADWHWKQLKDWFFTSPYPPSYYYYHTTEEIRQREKEDRAKEEQEMQRLRIKVMELGIKDEIGQKKRDIL